MGFDYEIEVLADILLMVVGVVMPIYRGDEVSFAGAHQGEIRW